MSEIDSPTYVMGGTYRPTYLEARAEAAIPMRAAEIFHATLAQNYPVSIDDISKWNGAVNFETMRQVAQAVTIRAGYGNDGIDPVAESNATGAFITGMPWGLYWYVKVGKDHKKHVASFRAAWEDFGGFLPPVWDVEYTEYTRKCDTTNWLQKLINSWEDATGISPMIYTRASWWDYYTYRTDCPKTHLLWTAHYSDKIEQPAIPADWGKVAVPRTWTFWQWSADGNNLGELHGVESDSIDRNRYNGSIAEFNAKFGTSILPLGEISPPVEPPVEPTEPPIEINPLKRVKITTAHLNVRAGADVTATDLGELLSGSVVPVIDERGDWLRIDGWIHKNYARVL